MVRRGSDVGRGWRMALRQEGRAARRPNIRVGPARRRGAALTLNRQVGHRAVAVIAVQVCTTQENSTYRF